VRRIGYLFDSIIDPENLKRAYLEARRGKTLSVSALGFRACEETELRRIRDELAEGSFRFGEYRRFTITDPKRRVICAAPFRERVVHHAMIRVIGPILERYQIFHSYACRRGKGTERALLQAFDWARSTPTFLKLDIRKYYDSVDHELLRAQLARVFKDARLLDLLDGLIYSYRTALGKGLPIGNLTSQYFANHFLGQFDHATERSGFQARYLRYMDDMLFFPGNQEHAKGIVDTAQEYLSRSTSKPPSPGPAIGESPSSASSSSPTAFGSSPRGFRGEHELPPPAGRPPRIGGPKVGGGFFLTLMGLPGPVTAVAWSNGADIDPECLYADSVPIPGRSDPLA
jgi:retron-type reverse transcriptase